MNRNTIANATPKIMGDELRRHREKRGWTRRGMCDQLANLLGVDLSTQTLATYELGTRQCSAVRLAELCYILGIRTTELWSTVEHRMFGTCRSDTIEVDLQRIAVIERADLAPARAWARERLNHRGGCTTSRVELTVPAITNLAALCGLATNDVAAALRDA